MIIRLVYLSNYFSNAINSVDENLVFSLRAFDKFFQFPNVYFLSLAVEHVGEVIFVALSLHICDNNNARILNVIWIK